MQKSLMVATAVLLIGTSAAVAGPLHDAVKDGDLARLQELIAAGEDLTAQDKFVGTALHWAALKDDIEAARLLIDAGSDANLPKIGGGQQTALHIAAERGSVEVARLLVEAGADIEARTDEGATPLHTAAGADHVNVAKLLVGAGADIEASSSMDGATTLMIAATGNAVGAIALLVAAGADIDAKSPGGETALSFAAVNGAAGAVRKLIELGADLNGARELLRILEALGLDEIADILREAGASQ